MQTGIDQRGKPSSQSGSQAANGSSKDEYDYSRVGQGSYASTMNSSAMSDPYAASSFYPAYLSYPPVSQGGINDGLWSNSDPMYVGGYGQMSNDMYSGGSLFGGFDYAQMGYSWQYPTGEYSSWNTPSSQQPRKDDPRGYMTDHYYMAMGNMDAYGSADGGGGGEAADGGVRAVEQGLRNVSVGEKRGESVNAGRDPSAASGASASRAAAASQPAKPMTWASVAGKPASLSQQMKGPPKIASRPSAMPARDSTASAEGKPNSSSSSSGGTVKLSSATSSGARTAWSGSRAAKPGGTQSSGASAEPRDVSDRPSSLLSSRPTETQPSAASVASLNNGKSATHDYNPKDFNLNPKGARFFIIKSYSEDDIHRSIKYRIWCSTDHGNKRLDSAYHEREGKGPVYLFFSVNGSGHFCGMAQMVSPLDYNTSAGVWAQDKWKGRFEVKWIYVKDVPNSQLRHIRLENNENKPVTNSRDTQEVFTEQGKQVLRIVHQYRHTTSIFDDFIHYEKRQEEENAAKKGRREDSDSGTF